MSGELKVIIYCILTFPIWIIKQISIFVAGFTGIELCEILNKDFDMFKYRRVSYIIVVWPVYLVDEDVRKFVNECVEAEIF